MFENLKEAEAKYESIGQNLADPAVVSDNERFKKLMKEHKMLSPVIEAYRAYKKCEENIESARALLAEEHDPALCAMCEEEIRSEKEKREKLEEELKILLLPRDENDDKNVIVEIRAGTGGEEAALFAGTLYRMYTMFAEAHGFRIELMSANETGLGGYKEIVFMVTGEGAYSLFKFESGVHRVQRVPETESQGRIHTSTVTVAVLPEVDEVEFEINPADLQIETHRSGGAGGQHVNKTESAIRITHLPTGIVVSCQNERSQIQNRETAMKMLKSKLVEIAEREHLEKISDIKGVQKDNAWGSQIRSYVFCPYTMVKDHRTGYEVGNIEAVMNGDIDGFINEYLKQQSLGKLQNN